MKTKKVITSLLLLISITLFAQEYPCKYTMHTNDGDKHLQGMYDSKNKKFTSCEGLSITVVDEKLIKRISYMCGEQKPHIDLEHVKIENSLKEKN